MNLILNTAFAQVLLISYNDSCDGEMQRELKFVKQLATGLEHGARGDPVVKSTILSKVFPSDGKLNIHLSRCICTCICIHVFVFSMSKI